MTETTSPPPDGEPALLDGLPWFGPPIPLSPVATLLSARPAEGRPGLVATEPGAPVGAGPGAPVNTGPSTRPDEPPPGWPDSPPTAGHPDQSGHPAGPPDGLPATGQPVAPAPSTVSPPAQQAADGTVGPPASAGPAQPDEPLDGLLTLWPVSWLDDLDRPAGASLYPMPAVPAFHGAPPAAGTTGAMPDPAANGLSFLGGAGPAVAVGPLDRAHAEVQPGSIDWSVVAQLRADAAQRLSTWAGQGDLGEPERRALGRRIVDELLGERAATLLRAGHAAWDSAAERATTDAVLDMLFGLGRIQPLVDDPSIEDIYITGCDPTWLTFFGQPARPGPPVADTDQELIDFLAFIASRANPPRAFSPSQPNLDLNLGGGTARLSAQAWVTARPYATIRLHRHRSVGLDDLVALGTITPVMATFLAAAVKAKLSIVVAGEMGAGKTTLLRALCAELDPDEPIGTFETDYELLLHALPQRHRLVRAWEERQGHGDPTAVGRAGSFGLDEALFASFRQSLSRQIVGEVRGREIIPMIKAMQSGTGSLSTTHAQSARGAIDKLVTCAMETGVSEAYALRALGTSVKLVVYVKAEAAGGRRRRVVTEAVAVGFTAEGIHFTDVFTRAAGLTGPARAGHLPDDLRPLASFGFDLAAFTMDAAAYRREVGR